MKEKALKKYKELKTDNSNIDNEIVMTLIDEMPCDAIMVFDYMLYGYHIVSKEMYDNAVQYFVNPDNSKGPKWSLTEVENKINIDFDNKDYTLMDFAYVLNMKYSDIGDLISTDMLMKIAKRYLEDNDYYGDPSERAYCDAKKRIKYFENEKE